MKHPISTLLALAATALCSIAEEANGLRLNVQKTTLERDRDNDAFGAWDQVEKSLGLRVAGKNVSFKDKPEGTIEFAVVVKRWGQQTETLEKYAGSEKFPALKPGEETKLTLAKIPLSGYETINNRKQFVDSIEGWRVVVMHEGKATITLRSSSSFDKVLERAKPAR